MVAERQGGSGQSQGPGAAPLLQLLEHSPQGLASFAPGGKGYTALSTILPLQIYPLQAGTCVLPMRKPWVPAWLPSTCGSHLLGAPTHPFPDVLEEG